MVCEITDAGEKESIAGQILRALPDWFGVPENTAKYIKGSADFPFWAFRDGESNTTAGFIVIRENSPYTAEIYVMGVMPGRHRQGIGRQLFNAAYRYCRQKGYEFLEVKTVDAGRYDEYDRTRLFYEEMGFRKLEVFPTVWDEWNPCLVLVMRVDP